MKGTFLGELEELALLTTAILDGEGYGISIVEEIRLQTGRKVNIGALHTVLRRLEKKGLVGSSLGGATKERGGRRKRLFYVTSAGKEMIRQTYETRQRLYQQIPNMAMVIA